MAYDFLGLTNDVLARMNEVQLTSGTFLTARGFQIQCKNAVNESIKFINQKEYSWPFNHALGTETLVAGTTRYSFPANAKHVDFETFRLAKDDSLGSSGRTLPLLDYKEYVDKYIDQEDDASVNGSIPRFVFRTPDNNYGLYPYPDKAYTVRYDYYTYTTELVAAADAPTIPEQYRQIIVDGATAFAYQYRGESQQYGINWTRFEQGIKEMQSIVLNRNDYLRSTYIVRSSRNAATLL